MSFLKSPPLKTLELIYDIIISQVGALFVPQPPPPPDAFKEGGRTGGLGGLWRIILMSFLKSPPLKTLELIFHIIFISGGFFCPPPRHTLWGVRGSVEQN